jgi:hypothetical protein
MGLEEDVDGELGGDICLFDCKKVLMGGAMESDMDSTEDADGELGGDVCSFECKVVLMGG